MYIFINKTLLNNFIEPISLVKDNLSASGLQFDEICNKGNANANVKSLLKDNVHCIQLK